MNRLDKLIPRRFSGTLASLRENFPQAGRLDWIGRRPSRGEMIETLEAAELVAPFGVVGDRYAGRTGGRAVTIIQSEHLSVLASLFGGVEVTPAMLRRNLAVSGINLLALKGQRFRIGETVLEHTGLCHPCSLMEEQFGEGGYNALRGHGGITARVVVDGRVRVGDTVQVEAENVDETTSDSGQAEPSTVGERDTSSSRART